MQAGALLLAALFLCAPVPARSAAVTQTYGPVRPGETLWQIARRVYPGSGLDRDQVMLALLEANPGAFEPPCNVNGALRVGALLVLPGLERVAATDAEAARRALAVQNSEWRAHRRTGQPLECPRPAPADREDAAPLAAPIEAAAPEPVGPPAPGAPVAPPSACPPPPPERPCPSGDEAQASPGPLAVPPPQAGEPSAPSRLAPGARAPAWLLVPLILAVLATALVGWGGRRRNGPAAVEPEGMGKAPAPAARIVQALALGPGTRSGLLVLAALSGVLGAAVTVLFREAIHGLEWLIGGDQGSLVVIAEGLPPWQRLLLPGLGGLIAGLVLQEIGGRLRGPATTDYMAAVAVGDGWISVRHSLVKAASSLFTVASGGSIGREGAMVQLSAMVASALGRLGRFPTDRLRLLVAAGAAAGLASAYNAPLAASMFVAEIVLGSIAIEHIGPLIIAAVVAGVTVHDILGYAPVYQIPEFHLVSDWELGLYLLLGLVVGHMAPLFLQLLERSHQAFGRIPLPLAGRLALGGLLVGLISVYEPQVWGNGYSVVDAVLKAPWAWQTLLTVLVLKMFATAATHGSGAVGGAFTPTLFVGAMLGALFGTLVQAAIPVGTAPPNAYAVVGMGAMLAGTTHAPFMSILMIFEMTMDYAIVLPLMLAVVTAHYTARRYTGVRPMYAESLLPREPNDLPAESAGPLFRPDLGARRDRRTGSRAEPAEG
ncbi:MAG: ClcB-like voltage-gated chloride channel protein [Bdellovibrio bacteriovorus]